ncbi:toxin-antitoxin system HicB family antitoxin [Actinophytocola sp.]|uniref:toxin-antitoxin system HicB family antitoxin n=1 Tax=Actinophytocola sp. TaxID=1872138 RepID=UPI003D6A0E7B
MDLTPHVDNVRRELAVAAEAGGEDARALAERLTAPLASAIRLALLDALSAAADEITRDLAPGSVEVRLRAGEPTFAVSPPAVEPPAAADSGADVGHGVAEPEEDPAPDEDGAMARINFRLPEHLKARIEEAAAAQGRSVNAWLVRATSAALRPVSRPTPPTSAGGGRSPQHYTGWVG